MMLFRKIAVSLGCIGFCFLTACSLGSSGSSVPQSVRDWIGRSESWTYDGSEVQYELPDNVRTLDIDTNGEAVDVFMAKVNFSTECLPKESTRYIVSSNTRFAENQSFSNSLNILPPYANTLSNSSDSTIFYEDSAAIRNIDLTALSVLRNSTAPSSTEELEWLQITPVDKIKEDLDVEKKELWVDLPNEKTNSAYKQIELTDGFYTRREATLKYIGEFCYIWVVDDDTKGITTTKENINSLGEKFDDIYEPVREVFGKESNMIADKIYQDTNGNSQYDEGDQVGYSNLLPMDEVCATGSKVNIVVYDINGDYSADQESGTIGYFANKDYFGFDIVGDLVTGPHLLNTTNSGKYFYVDSGFLNKSIGLLYSVLAHEFQHMIHYGVKTFPTVLTGSPLLSGTWFNEMLSMVCEDMMQTYLNTPDKDAPVARFERFASGYYQSGLVDWLNGDNDKLRYSYAGAYAFGAYLARNYGGKDLINKIATNEYVNQESITAALQACNYDETFETVFEKYMQALLLDNPPPHAKTFNKTADGIGGEMKAINLFNGTIKRPDYLGADAASRVELRPYGFTLHHLGSSQSNNIQLNFSSPVNKAEKIYILVQPHKQ